MRSKRNTLYMHLRTNPFVNVHMFQSLNLPLVLHLVLLRLQPQHLAVVVILTVSALCIRNDSI
jgi:hypothetical protein